MKTYEVLTEGWINGSYCRKGERVAMPADSAKWLILGGQIKEAEEAGAPAAGPASPLDHDGDGRPGGSKPAGELPADIGAAALADLGERNAIDFATLRAGAQRFLGADTPSRKKDIITALRALAAGD